MPRLIDGLLRGEAWTLGSPGDGATAPPDVARWMPTRSPLPALAAVMVVFGLVYGTLMGTFGGVGPTRWEQMLYSALKVPLLLGVTFVLSLPSFFVINSLLGLRDDFGRVVRALVSTQAGLAVVLASLGPLTVFTYATTPNYELAKLCNGLMFLIASVAGQLQLSRYYRPLVAGAARPPLGDAPVGAGLRLRRHPAGLGPAAVHRCPGTGDDLLPRRGRGATPTWRSPTCCGRRSGAGDEGIAACGIAIQRYAASGRCYAHPAFPSAPSSSSSGD